MSEFWKKIVEKVLSQSLLVIVGFGLLYYSELRNERQYKDLINEKDKAYTLLLEATLMNRDSKEAAWEGLFKERETRITEQAEMYQKLLDCAYKR